MHGRILIGIAALAAATTALAQTPARKPNVDEASVGSYVLPELLRLQDGTQVRDKAVWESRRRPELLELFAANQFGRTPSVAARPRVETIERDGVGLGGLAKRSQVRLVLGGGADAVKIRVVRYLPAKATTRVPVLLHIGFSPNVLVFDEPGIDEGMAWDVRNKVRVPDRKATLLAGFDARPFLEKGYGVAHVYYGDIEPDFAGGAAFGVRKHLGGVNDPRRPDEWGAIGAWSWGLSRILDWLQADPGVDGGKIALSGASRLGKTALWAAAQDPRFALVMPVISGESGAAISRRDFGETIADIASPSRFHYWFAPRYFSYAADVANLPVDAHMLLALVAPRPMLLVNGDEDTWSDWKGESAAAEAARPAYALYGAQADLAVFTHKGGHKLLPEDLAAMSDFMARQFGDPVLVARNAAMKANLLRPSAWWPALADKPQGWFASDEARRIADNILSWQDPGSGGWPLMNTTAQHRDAAGGATGPWGSRAALIKATVNEMRFLARAQAARSDTRFVPAIDRGLGYILGAQYPTGGFPHSWPTFNTPYDHQATFNDDEMVDLLELLRDVATRPEFKVLPAERRRAAQTAFDRGIDFILKTQIRAGGTLTAWAQQYDEKTLEPRGARKFEPVAISGGESANVLLLLMSIERPGDAIKRAIHAGAAWYRAVAITGIRVEHTGRDRIVHRDPSAPPVWARYYQIGTNRPIFVGRDGIIRHALAEVEQERRGGYAWYGDWGRTVLDRYAGWRRQHP
ncbi:pectate lyase [Sphingomonas turrisvirgatae]|uniref:Pectate lyase n=1 Tax=Sphingomonas turrisvirgatae TaxID=1888892 RepID=A0A1E3LYS6_9SPHN|nr:pectate lyase [Sphingomonas turrisvirgatae]ODP38869.1 pectate lyase [Sphingomonas turrisvirgatae]